MHIKILIKLFFSSSDIIKRLKRGFDRPILFSAKLIHIHIEWGINGVDIYRG